MEKPREYTKEEIREQLLSHLRKLSRYWLTVQGITTQERIEGGIFSVLTALDGSTDLPKFQIIPEPHPMDKDYHIENEENYYPYSEPNPNDIGGGLHEGFYQKPE